MDPVIILDYDGVVADAFEVYLAEFTDVCRRLGLRRLNHRKLYLKAYEGDCLKRMLWAALPTWLTTRFVRRLDHRINAVTERVHPFEGIPEAIRDLGRRHPVYVITSNTTQAAKTFLAKHGIEGVRDVLGVEVENSKVKKIRGIVREHPGRTAYYVGDTKVDMLDARRAGAVPIGAAWGGWHDAAKLREGNPEHLLSSPGELRAFFLEEPG